MSHEDNVRTADKAYQRYLDFYGDVLINGISALITNELRNKLHGDIKAGVITVDGQDMSHYWLVVGGRVIDPILSHLRRSQAVSIEEFEDYDAATFDAQVSRYKIYELL